MFNYAQLMSGNQQGEIGQSLLNDILAPTEASATRDLDNYRAFFTRRGLSGSGIESKGLADYFVNRDASRRGAALNVLGALTPYNQMQFQAHESQVERDWKDYMQAKYGQNKKKGNSWVGSLVNAGLSVAMGPLMGMQTGDIGVGGSGSTAPYTDSWG